MQKLTKEQANEIINRLSEYCFMAPINNDVEMSVIRKNILLVLRECTEKKFPYFKIENKDCGSIEVNGSIHTLDCVSVGMNFKGVKGCVACIDLTRDEFNRFANACADIMEFLDAENN